MLSNGIQGGNIDARNQIVDVKGYITFEEALAVLKQTELSPQLQAAYLDFVISAFVDNAMDQSGTNIENIWKSYVSGQVWSVISLIYLFVSIFGLLHLLLSL